VFNIAVTSSLDFIHGSTPRASLIAMIEDGWYAILEGYIKFHRFVSD